MLKYELTDETIEYEGHTLHRIRALKDFDTVKKGALGGWIESEENLSQEDNAWVFGNAMVYEGGSVWSNARVCNNAKVFGHALICGDAQICDEAIVCGGAVVGRYANINMNMRIEGNVTMLQTPSFFS